MGPEEMHPRVLRDVAGVVAKPLLIVFEKSWLSCEVPSGWKKKKKNYNVTPISEKIIIKNQGEY